MGSSLSASSRESMSPGFQRRDIGLGTGTRRLRRDEIGGFAVGTTLRTPRRDHRHTVSAAKIESESLAAVRVETTNSEKRLSSEKVIPLHDEEIDDCLSECSSFPGRKNSLIDS